MYETTVTCPVCGEVLDVITHDTSEPNAQCVAMLCQPKRSRHRDKSPECMAHQDWIKGWNTRTVEVMDRPKIEACPEVQQVQNMVADKVNTSAGIRDEIVENYHKVFGNRNRREETAMDGKTEACQCGAKKGQIISEYRPGRWTCYCNSCGLNENEAYGDTRSEAISNWNTMQARRRIMMSHKPCRCGCNKWRANEYHPGRWNVRCQSCGRLANYGYGSTSEEALADWERNQEQIPIFEDPCKKIEHGKTYRAENGLHITIFKTRYGMKGKFSELEGTWTVNGTCIAAPFMDGMDLVVEVPKY